MNFGRVRSARAHWLLLPRSEQLAFDRTRKCVPQINADRLEKKSDVFGDEIEPLG
jgi:hypothetical protein